MPTHSTRVPIMSKGKYGLVTEMKGRPLAIRRIFSRGRVQIPSEVRKSLDVKDGDDVYWFRNRDGDYCLAKVTST